MVIFLCLEIVELIVLYPMYLSFLFYKSVLVETFVVIYVESHCICLQHHTSLCICIE